MLLHRLAIATLLAGFPLAADTIYPQQTTVTLNTGDSLAFIFSESGYAADAAAFGASAAPDSLSFGLTTADVSGGFDFSAVLLAYDCSAEAEAANEAVTEGLFHGSYYTGSVSVASGSISLSASDSAAIFGSPRAVLLLENTGAAVTLGLPPYTLAQDMRITLSGQTQSGGILSVGGVVTSVSLDRASAASAQSLSMSPLEAPGSDAPEPGTGVMIAAGVGALLVARRKRH